MTLSIVDGMKQPRSWRDLLLIPVWDGVAFFIWLASFLRRSIRWRGADYYIREGKLVAGGAGLRPAIAGRALRRPPDGIPTRRA